MTSHTVSDMEALRAILVNVRRQGYAATDQELEEGLRSLAVPLRNASGTVTAALNLSVHASRASMASLPSRLPADGPADRSGDRGRPARHRRSARRLVRAPGVLRRQQIGPRRDRSRTSRFANRRRGENQSVADAVRPCSRCPATKEHGTDTGRNRRPPDGPGGGNAPKREVQMSVITTTRDPARLPDDELLLTYHDEGDSDARDELVRRFIPFARKLALRYVHSREPLDDLVQVACVGLLKALEPVRARARQEVHDVRRADDPGRAQALFPRQGMERPRPTGAPGAGAGGESPDRATVRRSRVAHRPWTSSPRRSNALWSR